MMRRHYSMVWNSIGSSSESFYIHVQYIYLVSLRRRRACVWPIGLEWCEFALYTGILLVPPTVDARFPPCLNIGAERQQDVTARQNRNTAL